MNKVVKIEKCLAIAALLLSGCSGFAESKIVATDKSRVQVGSTNPIVTPVTGESWLTHLNRPFGETSMGKTGHLGPAPGREIMPRPFDVTQLPAKATLKGSDLYRLNCQGCHGESGLGAPPEINSVINPVRSTSAALVMERMKNAGMDIPRADAVKLAQQSNQALLQRLHNGGENMPAFSHLSEPEIRSLVAYLKELAGVPGAVREQSTVRESANRVGELIVKSTCHTCHSAVGPDPGPQQLLDGAIPPLNSLATRKSQPEFIQKVTLGAPILMGTPPLLYRGRMPVFYYLSEEEAADVYLYLTRYPPSEEASSTSIVALSQQEQAGPSGGGSASPGASLLTKNISAEPGQPEGSVGLRTVVLSLVVAFVFSLLAGGLAFTLREFKRLSAVAVRTSWKLHGAYAPMSARPTRASSRRLTTSALSPSLRR
jgi:mono/diheme cytochrome c family protein